MKLFLNNVPVIKGGKVKLRCGDLMMRPAIYESVISDKDNIFQNLIGEVKYKFYMKGYRQFTLLPLDIRIKESTTSEDSVEISININENILLAGCNIAKNKSGLKPCPKCEMDQKIGITYAIKTKHKIEINRIRQDINHSIATITVPKNSKVFLTVDTYINSDVKKRGFWANIKNETNILNGFTSVIPLTSTSIEYADFQKISKLWKVLSEKPGGLNDDSTGVVNLLTVEI